VKVVADEAAAVMALIENIQREDLNPLEEAQGLKRLVDEFHLTHEQAAQAVGRSRSAASNLLRLLNLTAPVQQMLMAGDIEMGHARALLALDAAQQILCANEVTAKKLSVRDTEVMMSTPSMPAMESSSGLVTWDSTTSEDAPSSLVLTVTSGSSMRGYSRSESCLNETRPTSTSSSDITLASTGRRIEVSDSRTIDLPRPFRAPSPRCRWPTAVPHRRPPMQCP